MKSSDFDHVALFEKLRSATPAMLHSIDRDGRLVFVSDRWLNRFGYLRNEVIGQMWPRFLSPQSRLLAEQEIIPTLFRTGECRDVEYQVLCKDGSLVDVRLSSVVEPDGLSSSGFSLTFLQDITEERRLQAALSAQNELLRVTLQSIGDGVIRTDAFGRVDFLNPVAEKLTGWTNNAALGRPSEIVFKIVSKAKRGRVRSPVLTCLKEDRVVSLSEETILISRNCDEYSIKDSAAPIKNAAGETIGVVLVFYDVTEQRKLSDEMRYRATHDAMTGLVNRDEFERRLNVYIRDMRSSTKHHALMYVDLDKFKLVNDAGGHAAGDQLLKHIALMMRKFARHTDTVARVGGDEFALIIQDCSLEAAETVARKICERVDQFRFQFEGQRLQVGASIGLVPIDARWSDAESVLRAADGACFAAKQGGRNRFYTYIPSDFFIESHREDMQWVRRLETALDNNQFVLHWQHISPLKNVSEGVHCEILIRLIDSDGTLIAPGIFLPSAERFHITPRIDRWVVRAVFAWMVEHSAALSHVSTVSINLSGHSISDKEFLADVLASLKATGVDPRKLCFEVTETAAITSIDDATIFFEAMRKFGVRFALDDFGSGAASFGYLKNLPVDYLKIDGQFIRNLFEDKVDQATVRCIHEVAQITGKKTVAEFVETEEVEAMLRTIGIDYSQGFLRHRPAKMESLLALKPVADGPT